jgi:dephospho-CoA kinase
MNMSNNNKYIIGLTGNIACGKSAVVQTLAAAGVHTIDADAVTRNLQHPGQPVYDHIVAAFGTGILLPDGTLDRKALGAIVFADPVALKRLEQLIHPAVRQHILAWLAALPTGTPNNPTIAVIDAIKLIESGWPASCNTVWVVTAPRTSQITRLIQTRGMSEADAILRIDAQAPQADKVARADVVFDNSGTLESLQQQVHTALAAVRTHLASQS